MSKTMAYSLNAWRLVRIHGRDPIALLNGQTTVDMKKLVEGQGVAGAICTPKGRMVANFGVALFQGDAYLSLPADRVEAVEQALAKFLPFFGCQYEMTEWRGLGDTTPMQAEIQMDIGGLIEGWSPQFSDGKPGWEALRIERALAWISDSSHEAYTPQQLHLQSLGGISFTKGCYSGQEVVARTEHLGAVKKTVRPVILDQPEAAGDLFVENRKVGSLINVFGTHGLAVLGAEIDECVTTDGILASVQPLPFEIVSPLKLKRNQ
ncbi:MAG: YgfZ/GcvT domain-containing protein [Litorivicinus sp.]